MFSVFRRFRSLALLLALAVPGLGGSALQLLHPCPVDTPWLVPAHGGAHPTAMAMPMGMPMATPVEQAPASDHHSPDAHHGCHCVGSCTFQSVTVPAPVSPVVATTVAAPVAPQFPVVSARIHARPADRLPPATAPPLA